MEPAPSTPPFDARTRLVLAALKVFASKNFEGATIREIAKLADANSALIQYYFKGKEGLYLEAVKFTMDSGCRYLSDLPPHADPGAPEARATAIANLKAFLRGMIQISCEGHHRTTEEYGPEITHAMAILWTREVQTLHPVVRDYILEVIAPIRDYVRRCFQVLRPDLDEETTLLFEMSLHGQLIQLENQRMLQAIRGVAYAEGDIDRLLEHFFAFTLRGLGVPEAFPVQGA